MKAGQIALMKKIFKGCSSLVSSNILIDGRLITKKNISGILNFWVSLVDLPHEFNHNQLFGIKSSIYMFY